MFVNSIVKITDILNKNKQPYLPFSKPSQYLYNIVWEFGDRELRKKRVLFRR